MAHPEGHGPLLLVMRGQHHQPGHEDPLQSATGGPKRHLRSVEIKAIFVCQVI